MPTTANPASSTVSGATPLHRIVAALAAANAAIYGLIATGVFSVGRAEGGELGILGAAGVVYLVLALLLWFVPRPLVWLGAALLQVPVIAMYVAIASERDPSYEVWGITLRVLQVALLVTLVTLLVQRLRDRHGA